MAKFTADGVSKIYIVNGNENVGISIQGAFGGGMVAINEIVEGVSYPLLQEQVAIAYTAADKSEYAFKSGDQFQLVLSGSTSPAINYKITGPVGNA